MPTQMRKTYNVGFFSGPELEALHEMVRDLATVSPASMGPAEMRAYQKVVIAYQNLPISDRKRTDAEIAYIHAQRAARTFPSKA